MKSLREGKAALAVSGLCLTIAAALLLIFPPVVLQQAELRLYDLMISARTTPPQSSVPVLVGIDEESLRAYGQWPWPRYRLALLLKRLHELGADVVGLDFLMPEPDRTSPEVIMSERRRDLQTTDAIPQTTSTDSNSRLLADALREGPSVLGFFLDFTDAGRAVTDHTAPTVPAGMVLTSKIGSNDTWPRPKGLIRSMPLLTGAAGAEGFTNTHHDLDGALRRVPLLLYHKDNYYPSFALSAILLASRERALRIVKTDDETALIWGSRRIPLDQQGNMLLDFRNEQHSFDYLSARTILNSKQAPGSLKGKIVLVGAWAKGLGDLHLVPSGSYLNGLTIHATIIDNILAGTFITRPYWTKGAELFAVLALGVATTWLLTCSGFMLPLLTIVAGSGGLYLGARELIIVKGLYISPLLPMLTPIIIMTFLSLLKYGIEAQKVRQRTRDLMYAQDTVIISMSTLAGTRDKETGQHIQRTQRYVEILARELSTMPQYSDLDEIDIELLTKSAPLHDIGKVGIPDSILRKPDQLTDEEYAVMKTHTLIGVDAIAKTISGAGHPEQNDFLRYAQQMIESHHERWDGSGYPHGLRGEEIPLAGRLMALADVYDALVSQRVYKRAFSHEETLAFILDNSGKQFDPTVVAAFVAKSEEFFKIAVEFVDNIAPEPEDRP